MENPQSTYVISPVTALARSDSRNAATLPTSSMVTLRRNGACLFDEMQDLRKAADPRRGECLDRSGGNRVHTDAFGTEILREVAHVGLEARLGQTHDVVVRDRAHGAEVGQRQQRGVAPLHQRPRALGERSEAVRTDVVRDPERIARQAAQKIAGQRLARREGDRMQQAIKPAPFPTERVEQCCDLFIVGDVTR